MKRKSTLSGNSAAIWRALAFGLALTTLASCRVLESAAQIDPSEIAPQENGTRVTLQDVRSRDPQSGIGAKGHPKILASHGGIYRNAELEALLAIIAGKLVAATDEPDRAYDITILNSPGINAFALPGGYIYVTRGLLALANDSAEVAAVLAHEMAHVSSNHGLLRRERAEASDIAKEVVDNVVSNPVAGEVARASTQQRLSAFSQRQELQADAVGIKLLAKAGYDPFAAARFLENMERFAAWRSAANAGSGGINSSHPSTPQRVELARRHARILGPQGTGKRDRERFLKGIDGMIFGDTAKDGYVRGNRFSHAALGITFSVPDDFDLSNREDAVLAAGPNEMALRFDAVDQEGTPPNPTDYLKSGWVNGLDTSSVRPVTINGLAAATGRAEAGDWQFSITVIDAGTQHYRFILAAPRGENDVASIGNTIAQTFGTLSDSQKQGLRPQRLAIVAGAGTVASAAARMKGVKKPQQLLRALNGLDPSDQLPESGIKIVVD